ncbi:hypothetical protein GUJ93_ZPchr0004g38986 [Zizania palustris]|uniref:Uncharacterized protein n=1 Tax=Zizania palustris TaxID=103762 RepID=A0A8J5S103_ZIZPA|nr:hypothetical protein GUJ93_ZPchr0004g38986 [Zizania palustris]
MKVILQESSHLSSDERLCDLCKYHSSNMTSGALSYKSAASLPLSPECASASIFDIQLTMDLPSDMLDWGSGNSEVKCFPRQIIAYASNFQISTSKLGFLHTNSRSTTEPANRGGVENSLCFASALVTAAEFLQELIED